MKGRRAAFEVDSRDCFVVVCWGARELYASVNDLAAAAAGATQRLCEIGT